MKTKKTLTLLLTLVMLLCLFPASAAWAYAKEGESGALSSAEALPAAKAGRIVTAETGGGARYTVEFTYEDLEYVLPGDESVALSEILNAVGLSGTPTEVEVSNSALFSASDESGAWVVTAQQPFSSQEWMKVTIGGVEYVIAVTDALYTTSTTVAADNISGDY